MPRHSQAALFLLGILRAETDMEHRLSAPKLLLRLAECGIKTERRSIYRAVDALRAHGEPIEKSSTGYYYAHAEEADALYALVAAVQAAGFLTDARKEALLHTLSSFYGTHAASAACASGAAIAAPSAADDAQFVAMQSAGRAIAAGVQLTFLAPLLEPGGTARLRVNPYAVALAQGTFWLICNVEGERGLARFPLTLLSGLREEPQTRRHFSEVSPYKARFDAEDAMRCLLR